MKNAENRSGLRHVVTEGELLPPDILNRILSNDTKLPGMDPQSFGLAPRERINEAINRSWQRMCSLWPVFQEGKEKLGEDKGTTLTRKNLLLPLFYELGYGHLQAAKPEQRIVKDVYGCDVTYAISHLCEVSPIHLVGCGMDIDKREPGVIVAALASPHTMVQEFLNRSKNYLWGFVSNGLKLRILRDSANLSRLAFIEFDLEGIFENQSFSDFTLLWLLCHQSRVEKRIPEEETEPKLEGCYLEQWTKKAQESALAALETLSGKVAEAICILGNGFLVANADLRKEIESNKFSLPEYFHELLRLVYRLIFCFVAEDRKLLHAKDTKDEARVRYDKYFSFRRLRQISRTLAGTKHTDLFESVKLVMDLLGREGGSATLGIHPMGGFLWSKDALPHLMEAKLRNETLLEAVRVLAWTGSASFIGLFNKIRRRPIDYEHLGARELGSIYESLLEKYPVIEEGEFKLKSPSGNERKKTGAYYTPAELIKCLLESALDPVLERAAKSKNPESAILSLKVCDPACGSGHFLLAAAHRMGERLAKIRVGDDRDPAPGDVHKALRDVISHCIYGVDVNPMSVELCKVSLWMEAMETERPLAYLEHHILCGNSLLGTGPDLIRKGLPEEAFEALDEDDKEAIKLLKKKNKLEGGPSKKKGKKRQEELYGGNNMLDMMEATNATQSKTISTLSREQMSSITASAQKILTLRSFENMPTDDMAQIDAKEAAYRKYLKDPDYLRIKMLDDLWCSAFVMKRYFVDNCPLGVTQGTILDFLEGRSIPSYLEDAVQKTAEEYQFLHWDLAFPEVAARGGFDVMLGNPPWERIKIQEKEWFEPRNTEIANATNAAERKKRIENLKNEDQALYLAFRTAQQVSNGASHYIRNSGRFPLCGRGDINLYTVFAENMRNLVNDQGRVGCIVPTGIATDDTTKYFFQDMVKKKSLVSLFDFENKNIFKSVHKSYKFCLLTTGNGKRPLAERADFIFFAHTTEDLNDKEKRFTLSSDDIALINPNTYTCPIFRTRKDAELTKYIYHHVPVLIQEAKYDEYGTLIEKEKNPWGIQFSTMFHMSNDSGLFRTKDQLEKANGNLDGNKFSVEKDCLIEADGRVYFGVLVDKKLQDGVVVDSKLQLENGGFVAVSRFSTPIHSGRWLPLYEAKMIHHYNNRWATYDYIPKKEKYDFRGVTAEELRDPSFCAKPRYWVHEKNVELKLKNSKWDQHWLIGIRDICRSTDERTIIGSIIPRTAAGNNLLIWITNNEKFLILISILSSYVCDFFARFKVGGTHLNFFIAEQISILSIDEILNSKIAKIFINISDFIKNRVVRLLSTSHEMSAILKKFTNCEVSPLWDSDERFTIKSELDALMFHLYLNCENNEKGEFVNSSNNTFSSEFQNLFTSPREAVSYIMDQFPILKERETRDSNQYRTRDKILEIYDKMSYCMQKSIVYE